MNGLVPEFSDAALFGKGLPDPEISVNSANINNPYDRISPEEQYMLDIENSRGLGNAEGILQGREEGFQAGVQQGIAQEKANKRIEPNSDLAQWANKLAMLASSSEQSPQ